MFTQKLFGEMRVNARRIHLVLTSLETGPTLLADLEGLGSGNGGGRGTFTRQFSAARHEVGSFDHTWRINTTYTACRTLVELGRLANSSPMVQSHTRRVGWLNLVLEEAEAMTVSAK